MADPSSSAMVRVENPETVGERGRGYTKGIWTLHETLVLLDAKKLDDERRMRGGDKERGGKTAELRWKWVENYCFKNGCIRSQNQCNDKWDNLLRDYKKVREYENRIGPGQPSYWDLEKHERKERGLPSNLLNQVYERLHEVVDKRYPRNPPANISGGNMTNIPLQQQQQQLQLPPPPPQQQNQQQQQQPQPQPQPTHQAFPSHQQQRQMSGGYSAEMSESSDNDGSEVPHSSAKRRRVGSGHGLAPAMSESTIRITQTLMACEEKKDKRHMDILDVEEKKIRIEEAKTEISKQGIAGLISAVNNLANAILTLASERSAATE
ncbi:trihelix transcription factor ASR3 [Cryptomeria japonica]|uniref:trihelix transcription factor ASR3 n=1 Tax=Cryptomeria japonica TaxID=3369 RepID=UPI0025AC7B4A|nr:trihelix transcription factor ASR3 [Cryptomeria japonica]